MRVSSCPLGAATFILIVLIVFAVTQASAIELRRTGQIKCYEHTDPFAEIACAGTGQDGDIRAGTPIPDPHFSDNGDGTLTDNASDLIWLQDIDCFSDRTWGEGLTDVALLAGGQCGLADGSAAGDWRMPNVVELESLFNGAFTNLRPYLLGVGFIGTNAGNVAHWSSTTSIGRGDLAFTLEGHQYAGNFGIAGKGKAGQGYVLPVRGGSTQVRKTGQATCYEAVSPYAEIPCSGTGQDGEYEAGVAWPVSRFTDNGDGTVTDGLTGLMWLKNANCFGNLGSVAALATAAVLANGQCGLSDGSSEGQWRVPNRTELFSLLDYGENWPKFPSGHPFANLPTGYQVGPWTSTIYSSAPWNWFIIFGDTCCGGSGAVSAAARGGRGFPMWPVRDGAETSLLPDITVTDEVDPTGDLAMSFGDQASSSARDRTVTLRNDGGADLTIGTIAVADPVAAPFSIVADDCSDQTLPQAASCTLTVRCTPSSRSNFVDTFDIPSDDRANPVATFSLSGHSVTCGDANDDGRIVATDALVVLKTAVGSSTCSSLDWCICDVDGASNVTATDALMVLQYAVGLSLTLDCVC